jgi:hypothetical protein
MFIFFFYVVTNINVNHETVTYFYGISFLFLVSSCRGKSPEEGRAGSSRLLESGQIKYLVYIVITLKHCVHFQGKDYLQQFGWLPSFNAETFRSATATNRVVQKAVRMFQRFWGLPETGEMDNTTREFMDKPRCGIPDNVESVADATTLLNENADTVEAARRKKRYIIQPSVRSGRKWKRYDLKYRVTKYTNQLPKDIVDGVLRKAFFVSHIV